MEEIRICDECLSIRRIVGVIYKAHKGKRRQFCSSGRESDALIYVLQGSVRCDLEDGRSLTAKKDEVLYLARNVRYSVHILEDNYTILYCNFDFESEKPRYSEVFTLQNTEYIKGLFRRLYKLSRRYSSSALAEGFSILYEIYSGIMVSMEEGEKKTHSARIREARSYISAHLEDSSLSVALLAERCEMSEVYFRRLFREAFGASPVQYMKTERLRKAKELMKYSFLSLEEVAEQSGFSGLPYFCRMFKAEFGVTPSQFRKREYRM